MDIEAEHVRINTYHELAPGLPLGGTSSRAGPRTGPTARAARPSEREGAFGNAAITAEVRYSLVTKHFLLSRAKLS